MSESNKELEPKKEVAILSLLSSRSIEEAAQVAGVDPRTLYRWMKEPAFDAEYRTAKRAAYSQALARLHQMASAAVSTIAKIMVDQNAPASIRLRAADSVLAHVETGIELQDIEARVAELERATEANKGRS
jgi:DNA-binding transcriptional MerR regulator